MSHSPTKFVAFLILLASAVVQANQCSRDGECPNAALQCSVSLLQTKLQKNAIEDSYELRYAMFERQVQNVEKEGVAVVIPGLGDAARTAQVERNLQWLKNQDIPFECWIFVYRTEEEFPLDAARFEPCHIVRHGGFWMGHVLAMPLNMTNKPWIVHMLDSVEPQQDVNLKLLLRTMVANSLGMASPTFDVHGWRAKKFFHGTCPRPIMARQRGKKIGRLVDGIELQFDVFSREYFACLQDIIDIDNGLGWGMEKLMPKVCGGAIGGSERQLGRLGLMDQMTMVKRFSASYDYAAAAKSADAFMAKHPGVPGPRFIALGELEAPEAFEEAAAKGKGAEEAFVKERAAKQAAAEEAVAKC